MMAAIPAITAEAARRIEAARTKFNPTEEDLHPRMKFAENRISALLEQDPDFQKLLERKSSPGPRTTPSCTPCTKP